MKKLKLFAYSIGSIFCGMALSACLDDNEPESFFTTLSTVSAESKSIVLESDSYGTLVPENPGWVVSADADSIGQRVLAGIQFTGEATQEGADKVTPVRIVEMLKVLTKKADDLREGGKDVYGNDPIQITGASLSREHLNIQYTCRGGYDARIPHRISLVLSESSHMDGEGLLAVEFRHNAEGDMQVEDYWGIASYTLESISEYAQEACKGIKISYNSGANSRAQWIIRKGTQDTPQNRQGNNARPLQACR